MTDYEISLIGEMLKSLKSFLGWTLDWIIKNDPQGNGIVANIFIIIFFFPRIVGEIFFSYSEPFITFLAWFMVSSLFLWLNSKKHWCVRVITYLFLFAMGIVCLLGLAYHWSEYRTFGELYLQIEMLYVPIYIALGCTTALLLKRFITRMRKR